MVDILIECWDYSLEEVDISGAVIKSYPTLISGWSCKIERSQCHHHLTRTVFSAGHHLEVSILTGTSIDFPSNTTHRGSLPWDRRDSSTSLTISISDWDRMALAMPVIVLETLRVWPLVRYLSYWKFLNNSANFPQNVHMHFIPFISVFVLIQYKVPHLRTENFSYVLSQHIVTTIVW